VKDKENNDVNYVSTKCSSARKFEESKKLLFLI